jgi:hypothetical protein
MTTEDLALKILAALKDEWEREPSLLKCRSLSDVLTPIKRRHRLDDSAIDRAIIFLVERRMLKAVNRRDGDKAAQPSEAGFAHLSASGEKSKWTMDRRLKLYAIWLTILGLAAALVSQLLLQ